MSVLPPASESKDFVGLSNGLPGGQFRPPPNPPLQRYQDIPSSLNDATNYFLTPSVCRGSKWPCYVVTPRGTHETAKGLGPFKAPTGRV